MVTKTITKTEGLESIDTKLLHMWEAKKSLEKRWKTQKHNKRLRKRIATLSKDIEKYAEQLCRQQWEEKCDAMEKQISLSKTWNLLRCLIDSEASKTAQQQNFIRLVRKYKGTEEELIEEIRQRYIGDTTKEQLGSYKGKENDFSRPTHIRGRGTIGTNETEHNISPGPPMGSRIKRSEI